MRIHTVDFADDPDDLDDHDDHDDSDDPDDSVDQMKVIYWKEIYCHKSYPSVIKTKEVKESKK